MKSRASSRSCGKRSASIPSSTMMKTRPTFRIMSSICSCSASRQSRQSIPSSSQRIHRRRRWVELRSVRLAYLFRMMFRCFRSKMCSTRRRFAHSLQVCLHSFHRQSLLWKKKSTVCLSPYGMRTASLRARLHAATESCRGRMSR